GAGAAGRGVDAGVAEEVEEVVGGANGGGRDGELGAARSRAGAGAGVSTRAASVQASRVAITPRVTKSRAHTQVRGDRNADRPSSRVRAGTGSSSCAGAALVSRHQGS